MELKVDKEARETITQMADVVLKSTGLSSLQAVNNLMASMQDIKLEKEKPEKKA